MKTDRIDNIKLYCMLTFIFILIAEIILGAGICQEYKDYGVVTSAMLTVWLVLLFVEIVLLGIYYILRAYLKRKLGDSYVGASRMLRVVKGVLFPKRQEETESAMLDKDIEDLALWRQMCSGINMKYFFYFLFCLTFGSLFMGGGIYLWRWEQGNGILALVLGIIFGIICHFWAVVNLCAFRKRDGNLLQYVQKKGISFSQLNQDFLSADKMGNQIWIGKEYLFIYVNTGAQVLALDGITFCQVRWMGSYKHLPYYLLEIRGEGKTMIKYAVTPFVFYKLKKRLGVGKEKSDG